MLNGARVYLNSWGDCGAKCCTFEGLSTEGATVEWKSKWKVLKFLVIFHVRQNIREEVTTVTI